MRNALRQRRNVLASAGFFSRCKVALSRSTRSFVAASSPQAALRFKSQVPLASSEYIGGLNERVENDSQAFEYLADLKMRLEKSWACGLLPTAENLVSKNEAMDVLERAISLLRSEKNVVEATFNSNNGEELTVVGDTHGQYYDLLNMLQINGDPSDTHKYVFNGDFVDRGSFSFQVLFLLLNFKLKYPNSVFLTRGNHETVGLTLRYGFADEIKKKYDNEVLVKCWELFNYLPLACTVQNNAFPHYKSIVLHGGLFTWPEITLDDINAVDRTIYESDVEDMRSQMIINDILWSDPFQRKGKSFNNARGAGIFFGPDVTKSFLQNNRSHLLIRSHEVRENGWLDEHGGLLTTVFSAPNYCDRQGNKGAVLKFTHEKPQPQALEFAHVEHPPIKPMAFMF